MSMVSSGKRRSAASSRRRVLMSLGYYQQQMHRGIVRFARQAGWILDTSMAHYGMIPEHWQGHGILTLLIPTRKDVMRYVRRVRVPVVAMNADMPGMSAARVLLDNERIGELAARHFLERGFQNLGFYKFSDFADIRGRERGFRRTVEAARRT